MGNTKQKKQQDKQKKQHKKNSAVTFDEDERSNYLKGMIGCKRRRREFYLKKVEKETKDAKKQERLDYKAQRRDELRKAKELLEKLSDRVEQNYRSIHEQKDKVEINKANNLLV